MSSLNNLPGQKEKKPQVEATAWCYTASKGDTEFSFVWTIENFSGMIEIDNCEYLTSDAFKVEMVGKKTAWNLRCYPNGNKNSEKYIGLFLEANNEEAMDNKKLKFSLAILNKEGFEVKKNVSHCFSTKESDWGWKKFVSHEELESAKDSVLFEDRLTVLCVMEFDGKQKLTTTTSGVFKPSASIPLDMKMDPQEEDHGVDVLELLRTGYKADIKVVSEGRSFSCHKAILGTQSPVFRAAIEHDMKEKSLDKITIKDIEQDITEDMLTHIYGGKIENLEEKADKLLVVADKYDLKKLKKCCENIMAKTLDLGTCLGWLILADRHSAERLKPVIIKFVAENLREVAAQDSWKEMHTDYPEVFFEVVNEAVAFQPPK